jgi:hypothetical protein
MSQISRRNFFTATAAVGATLAIGPASKSRARSIERETSVGSTCDASNIALITASNAELGIADNAARHRELEQALRAHGFGVGKIRGSYRLLTSFGPLVTEVQAFFVCGNIEDSGNLKGHMRKLGRAYDQTAVIVKGYYRPAILHALRNVPELALKDRDIKDLGSFRPECLGAYVGFLSRLCRAYLEVNSLAPDSRRVDQSGGKWLEIATYYRPTILNSGTKITFSEDGTTINTRYGEPLGYGQRR